MGWRRGGAAALARDANQSERASVAPGAPGAPGYWSAASKTGIGTSYAPYGPRRAASRVWFSLVDGVLTETMFGLIHQAQLRELKFAVKGQDFVAFEEEEAPARTDYLLKDADGRPISLAYRLTSLDRHGRFELEKHVFTDPDRNALFLRLIVRAIAETVQPILLADPQMSSTSQDDRAEASLEALHAWDAETHLVIRSGAPFAAVQVGFVGVSDAETDLRRSGDLSLYTSTGEVPGNVALASVLGAVPAGGSRTFDIVLGFGPDHASASEAAAGSLQEGYAKVLAAYNGGEGREGWSTYLQSLTELPRLARQSRDDGRLLHVSAMVLKAQEDKTHPGALIASLSTPWGHTVSAETEATGYKAVWPRDFYQVASALLALGDVETPIEALNYLKTVQVLEGAPGNAGAGGWFLQKAHVDGRPEWTGVQLDQTAMPIMLADKLHRAGLISEARLRALYDASLKPAADFLTRGGKVDFLGTHARILPPKTQMERWEEQGGFSPSTTAAEISGLLAAADIARTLGDMPNAQRFAASARSMTAAVEARSFTTQGVYGDGRYFVRISPNGRPDSAARLAPRNGKPGRRQQEYLDAGFLELVRYGILPARAPCVLASLPKVDDVSLPDRLRLRYDFTFPGEAGTFPGWRRYSEDGYGEDQVTGQGFGPVGLGGADSPEQRGRVWPIFTGERGHYELALAAEDGGAQPDALETVRATYVRGLELFANAGSMLPEQVYDGVGASGGERRPGQGTGSATPLAWSHAEYVKLLRSLADGRVWDRLSEQALRP